MHIVLSLCSPCWLKNIKLVERWNKPESCSLDTERTEFLSILIPFWLPRTELPVETQRQHIVHVHSGAARSHTSAVLGSDSLPAYQVSLQLCLEWLWSTERAAGSGQLCRGYCTRAGRKTFLLSDLQQETTFCVGNVIISSETSHTYVSVCICCLWFFLKLHKKKKKKQLFFAFLISEVFFNVTIDVTDIRT